MDFLKICASRSRRPSISTHLFLLVAIPLTLAVAGCGSGGANRTTFTGNTAVTVLTSSTSNDALSEFSLYITGISLTDKRGNSFSLLDSPRTIEFMHQNALIEPLVTASIPQGIYTSATVSAQYGSLVCVTLDSTGALHTYGQLNTPASGVTVNLQSPIMVTGTGMDLTLNLQVPNSVSSLDCGQGFLDASVTPLFDLSPLTLASQPTNTANGKAMGLRGLIASVDAAGNSFSVTGDFGSVFTPPTFQVTCNGSTAFQGVTGVSQVATGMPVDMDAAIQPDGSLLATRVAVYDANVTDLSMASGPIENTHATPPAMTVALDEYQSPFTQLFPTAGGALFSFGSATFQTSGQMTNINNLPFTASFNAGNMVAGQNVLITTHATSISGGPIYTPASTVTLLPQTIDGTVNAVSNDGAFTTYTVMLAPYDMFPELAGQANQTAQLTNPGTMIVYADNDTQQVSGGAISVGNVFRFNGLVFNDNGTLRMDCAQISVGVPE